MLRPPRKLHFAIEAVLDIAYHGGTGLVQSHEITRRQGVPQRYLEQALQQLVRARILTGTRGPRGGYRLARPREAISLGDIVRAVIGEPAEPEDRVASPLRARVIDPVLAEEAAASLARMDAVTIEALCDRAFAAGVASEAQESIDYTI